MLPKLAANEAAAKGAKLALTKEKGQPPGESDVHGPGNLPYIIVVAMARRSLKHLYNAQVKALGNEEDGALT
uniref:Uncharacterized protein n=1 Tax=Cannabis sativa TaxID=3483 RepID=A0A803P8N0_CANSA